MTAGRLGVVALALALAGCQRGCLARWLAEHGFGSSPDTPGAVGPTARAPAPCPAGLARCSAGVVRVSTAYTPPAGCSPEGCKCPWADAQRCAFGCSAENVEIEMPEASAKVQLCAPSPGEEPRYARTLGPTEQDAAVMADDDAEVEAICEVERWRCANGAVSACDSGQAKPLAACVHGCVDGEGMIVEDVPASSALAILCARSPAAAR